VTLMIPEREKGAKTMKTKTNLKAGRKQK